MEDDEKAAIIIGFIREQIEKLKEKMDKKARKAATTSTTKGVCYGEI